VGHVIVKKKTKKEGERSSYPLLFSSAPFIPVFVLDVCHVANNVFNG
jgi:hypothetical protein